MRALAKLSSADSARLVACLARSICRSTSVRFSSSASFCKRTQVSSSRGEAG